MRSGGNRTEQSRAAPHLVLWWAIGQAGLTQTEVAQRVGISRKHLNSLVKGRASLRTASGELLEKLSDALGVSIDDLVKGRQRQRIG